MIAAPWYLLAGGIILIIIGYFMVSLGGGSSRTFIHPRMSDEEIEQEMNKAQGNPLGTVMMLTGFLAVFVSVVWRLVRPRQLQSRQWCGPSVRRGNGERTSDHGGPGHGSAGEGRSPGEPGLPTGGSVPVQQLVLACDRNRGRGESESVARQ